MNVLLCHAFYREPGGEDASFMAEAALLERHGHRVVRFTTDNHDAAASARIAVGLNAVWNQGIYRRVRALIQRERPDVMHCTNTFPTISPSILYAARAEGIPVVQSVRNFRMWCANAVMLRNGGPCDVCLRSPVAWRGVLHGCYRASRMASLVPVATAAVHRVLRTWSRSVDVYIAPSAFVKRTAVEGGLPPDRIVVKPNFVDPDPGEREGGTDVVFVGRLSAEKGLSVLVEAWSRMRGDLRLSIVGDGPEAAAIQCACQRDPRITWRGRLAPGDVLSAIGRSACLVAPSRSYETFGRTVVEAFAVGTPAIVPSFGAMAELVEEGRTGHLVDTGSASALAETLTGFFTTPAAARRSMRRAARAEYEQRFTGAENHRQLVQIYERARAHALTRTAGAIP